MPGSHERGGRACKSGGFGHRRIACHDDRPSAAAAGRRGGALWWREGRTILDRQQREAWGSGVLRRLADDLRTEFPTWPDEYAIGQQAVGQLPWGTLSC